MRVAVHVMVPAHGIHGAAHGVAAVQKRGRALDDLQPFELGRVDEFAVISRLRRQRPGPNAVLHDEHPVAVKPADDRPGRSRSETALGNPRPDPVVQHLAEGDIRGARKFQRSYRLDTLKRFESGLGFLAGRDGDLISQRRQLKQKIGGRCAPLGNAYDIGGFGEDAFQMGDHVIITWGDAIEFIRSIVIAERASPQLDNQDARPVERTARLLHRDLSRDPPTLLTPGIEGK